MPAALGWAWGRAAAVVAVVLSPLVIVSQQQAALVGWISRPGPPELLGFGVLALAGLGCARVPLPSRGPLPLPLRALALPLLLVPPATLLAVSYIHPLYVDRYVLYAYVGLALLLGAALERCRGRPGVGPGDSRCWRWPPCCRTRCSCAPRRAGSTTPRRRPCRTGADPARRRGAVSARPPPRADHVQPGGLPGVTGTGPVPARVPSGTLHGVELPAPAIRARMLTAGRIVTVNDPPGQPLDDIPQERMKREVLARYFHRCAVRDVTGMRVVLYARPGRC